MSASSNASRANQVRRQLWRELSDLADDGNVRLQGAFQLAALHIDALAQDLRLALDTIDRLEALLEAKERVTQRILREQMPERTPRPRLNGGNE